MIVTWRKEWGFLKEITERGQIDDQMSKKDHDIKDSQQKLLFTQQRQWEQKHLDQVRWQNFGTHRAERKHSTAKRFSLTDILLYPCPIHFWLCFLQPLVPLLWAAHPNFMPPPVYVTSVFLFVLRVFLLSFQQNHPGCADFQADDKRHFSSLIKFQVLALKYSSTINFSKEIFNSEKQWLFPCLILNLFCREK